MTSGANSPVSHSPRTTVPSGLSAGRLLAFLSQWGGLSHCSLGLSLFWPGRVGVIGCTGECRLPHDPRAGLICNYLLQCSGRLQFALVQDVDYLVYWDGRVVYMRVRMHAQACPHTQHTRSETLMSFHSLALTEAAMFLIRFSCHGIVTFLIKPLCATCIPYTGLHLIV